MTDYRPETPLPPPLDATVASLLQRLRWWIRGYVWLDGCSLALIWLSITFWAGLALDYFPVLFGASDIPWLPRFVFLVGILLGLAFIVYYWIARRVLVRLPNRSMAVVLERRFSRFHDGLVTAVEMAEHPEHAARFNRDMLAKTSLQAHALSGNVRVSRVFRFTPLLVKAALAAACLATVALFCVLETRAAGTWIRRLYLLQDTPWPRSTRIDVAGIQIERISSRDGATTLTELIPFDPNGEIKVAKGTSVLLVVRADAAKVIPNYCTVYYRTDQQDRGDMRMQRRGRIRDNYQAFVLNANPFKAIVSSVTFDVRGNDHRVRDYRLTVVPSPAIVETKLDCQFPDYMVNPSLSLWLPRTLDLADGTQLPNGTRITVRARANKDLRQVAIHDPRSQETTVLKGRQLGQDRRGIVHEVQSLQDSLTLEFTLLDTDGVVSDPPITIFVAGLEDQPPAVETQFHGIGSLVTPDVAIPVRGAITDDYDVHDCWFEVTPNESSPRKFPFPLGEAGKVDARLDFRAERSTPGGLALMPKDKFSIAVAASDKCDLRDTPNVGSSDAVQLEVVTPDELLAALEREELALRRRFEQTIDELNQMRDAVSRVKQDAAASTDAADLDSRADQPDDGTAPQDPAERLQALRQLRTQRAITQSQKSAQEVLGVAALFDDIREELVNNRVESEDRQTRLRDQIAEPLKQIGQTMFPELDRRLKDLETKLADPAAGDQAADLALRQTDDILVELDKVLRKMLELETFNELLNIVRSLMEDQENLIDKTKTERARQAQELLK